MSSQPRVLQKRDLPSLAKYIESDDCKNIILMLGAGVSTSAGIPDFRSPETGLYSNLARLNLPYPEAVFDINYFRRNPKPFYMLAHELYPGKYRPTPTHSFVRLLAQKNLLHTCFTQNIDTLERRAGVPPEKIIEAHGSFAEQRCIICNTPYDGKKMREKVAKMEIPKCEKCVDGLVKPDIVFFGESLPLEFNRRRLKMMEADLLIIIGTSLTVYPFAGLAHSTRIDCPRVLINLERVGDLGSKPDDVVLLGECDEVVKDLCEHLGWKEELLALWKETEGSLEGDEEEQPVQKEKAEDKVEELADQIGKSLALDEVVTGIKDKQVASKSAVEKTDDSPSSTSETPSESKALEVDKPVAEVDNAPEMPAESKSPLDDKGDGGKL